MLTSNQIYQSRVQKYWKHSLYKAEGAPELLQRPAILRDEREINFEESITNFKDFLLCQAQISSPQQIRIRQALNSALNHVNVQIRPRSIAFVELAESSSDSASGSPRSSDENLSSSPSPVDENNPLHRFQMINVIDPFPSSLLKGEPDFLRFIDQTREDLLILFKPDEPDDLQNYYSSTAQMKSLFSEILRAAGIWRTADFVTIVVPGAAD